MRDQQQPCGLPEAPLDQLQQLAQTLSRTPDTDRSLRRACKGLDTHALVQALQKGDTGTLQQALQQVLSTDSGQQLFRQVQTALGRS